jgi:polyhydroxyalkanoate synthesis regulator phasin
VDYIEEALDEARDLLDRLAAPDKMTLEEASDFYDEVAQHCQAMRAAVQHDLHKSVD